MSDSVPSQFYAGLQAQINASLPGTTVAAIDYDGGFNYYWQIMSPAGANVFNNATYQYIANRLGADLTAGTLRFQGDLLPQDLISEISAIRFLLSNADAATLTKVQASLQAVGQTIVQAYQQTYGPITTTQLTAAATALNWPPAPTFTALNYVIQYVCAYIWSGAYQSKSQPLTFAQLAVTPSLPNMDAQGAQVWADVQIYLNDSQSIWGIMDELGTNNGLLGRLQANITTPTIINGGMTTQDVNNNTYSTVGYTMSPPPQQIETQLQQESQKISLSMTANASGQQVNVQIGQQTSVWVDRGWFTCSFGTDTSVHRLVDIQGAGTSHSVTLNFPGFQLVQITPTAFSNGTGWWDPAILAATIRNGSEDVTGMRWVTGQAPLAFNFGQNGNFGQLSTLLISQQPSVTVNFHNGSYNSFSQFYSSSSTSVSTIFGIPFGSRSSFSYSSSLQKGSSDSDFTLTMVPNFANVLAQTQLQRQAYVLGGIAVFPGATNVTMANEHLRQASAARQVR
jgi:hypothetical protein